LIHDYVEIITIIWVQKYVKKNFACKCKEKDEKVSFFIVFLQKKSTQW